ncbi:MAG: NUDIX domain-containing protein [Lachnospiraceae bacterium]|nr:NUDIX domain-containing protein [Lachnospiraceae bacterium]
MEADKMEEKILFTIDKKNYDDSMPLNERFGVRALIKKDDLWAMQRGNEGIYKIPGGGVEKDETFVEALKREVLEETGLFVIEDSIEFIGEVQEIREDSFQEGYKYIAHSYFYFCDVKDETIELALTENEKKQGYRLEWAELSDIIETNERLMTEQWTCRDTMFLKWLRDRI